MLPVNSVLIPDLRLAKVASKLKIPFARAVTDFEHGRGKSYPVVGGVLIHQQHKEILLMVTVK
jgi:hypothetical protein